MDLGPIGRPLEDCVASDSLNQWLRWIEACRRRAAYQLTIRGLDDALSDSVHQLAEREGISLNRAALKLLRKGAGLADDGGKPGKIGDALDHFIGSWTAEEVDAVNAALQEFETIDESVWS